MPQNSTVPYAGRVEVRFNGQWGLVCHTQWNIRDADVACKQLGYAKATGLELFNAGDTGIIWMDRVQCEGDETKLWDCSFGGWGHLGSTCSPTQAAGVICETAGRDFQVRLSGGATSREGRVEVAFQGQWGTICDTNWDITDANIVCRQLGYRRADEAYSGLHFGRGSGLVLLDNAKCGGTETRIVDCNFQGWGIVHKDCVNHNKDAGVLCDGKKTFACL